MSYLTNQVAIQGILIKKTVNKGLTKDNREFMGMELTIRTSETEEHVVRMYSNKLTKDGSISKIYTALETVADEYKSAEIDGIENADKVFIKNGEISMNRYMDRMGELRESRKLTSKFCSRVEGEFSPRSEFSLVGVVESVIPKMNMQEEIECLKLNLIIPKGFNNLIDKIQVTIRGEEFYSYIEDNFTKGVVVRVGGNVINKVEKVEEEKTTSGFGTMPKINEKTIRTSELLATGGDVLYGVEETQFFTEDEISKGLELFNQSMEELKSIKPKAEPSLAPQGFGQASAPANPFGSVNVDKAPQMPNF